MDEFMKLSKEEMMRRMAKEPPLNIGIFVTGGEAAHVVTLPEKEKAV